MAPSPFRRRKAAKTVRNLAIAEAALALAKDRVGHGSRRPNGKLLLLGGAVAVAGAAALLKRDKVAGLLPSRASAPEPSPAPPPPQPSNYDAPGPVANTATPIPAPDPQGAQPPAIDEAAEEAAAAAEAGAIGGSTSSYAGAELGERASEAERPLAEAGEGEAEGQEQAEAQLADNATYRDAGMTDSERQIDDAIEQAGQPQAGETPEPTVEPGLGPAAAETDAPQPPATPGGGISGRPYAGLDQAEQAAAAGGETSGDATADTGGGEGADQPAAADQPGAETGPADQGTGQPGAEAGPADQPGGETGASGAEPTDQPAGEAATADAGAARSNEQTSSESTSGEAGSERSGEDEDSDDWRTWSGRAINP